MNDLPEQLKPRMSEERMRRIAIDIIEASREALPKDALDLGIVVTICHGELDKGNQKIRTRTISNLPEDMTPEILRIALDGWAGPLSKRKLPAAHPQLVTPPRHFVLRAEPGHYDLTRK